MKQNHILKLVPATANKENLLAKAAALPIGALYEGLAAIIAACLAHPDIAGNVEQFLCEFIASIQAETGDGSRPIHLDAPPQSPEFALDALPGLLIHAHNRVASEQHLPVAA